MTELPNDTKENNQTEETVEELEVIETTIDTTEQIQKELTEQKDKWLRLAADFENFKKISQREQIQSLKFANEAIIKELLPIIDNLESALLSCSEEEKKSNLVIGINMVHKQFTDTLAKFGATLFSAKSSMFDPKCHEAISEQINDEVEEGMILQEYQKGCYLHDRLLRPARVVVAKKS